MSGIEIQSSDVVRRTFRGRTVDIADPLNCDPVTSKYFTSHRYAVVTWYNYHKQTEPHRAVATFRTKREAEHYSLMIKIHNQHA